MDTVDDCTSFNDLQVYYRRKAEEIASATALMAKYSDMSSVSDEDRTVLNEICTDLGKIQKLMTAMNTERDKLAHTIACNKVTLERLEILKKQFVEQKENIPQNVPVPTSSAEFVKPAPPTPPPAQAETVKAPQQCVRFEDAEKPARGKSALTTGTRIPSKAGGNKPKKQKLSKTTIVPLVNHLTTEEFKSLPKYMVGRLKLEQINSMVDEINNATVCKYKIIDTPVNKLNAENMKRYARMTEKPDTKETAGMVWFEEADIRDFASTPTLVHSFVKIVPILRHCHRIRQIRAGKVQRYIVLL